MDIRKAQSGNSKSLDEDNARHIDDMLTYLALCESEPGLPSAREFDGAYLCVDGRDFNVEASVAGFHTRRQLREYAASINNWRGRFAIVSDEIARREAGYLYELVRIRSLNDHDSRLLIESDLDAAELRGSLGTTVEIYGVTDAGGLVDDGGIVFFRRGGRLLFPRHSVKRDMEVASGIATQVVINLRRLETTWGIQLRIAPGTPSVGFFTDPTGIKEFLRFRDKEDGQSRRSAMAHWVTQHWRQARCDPDVEVYVREHLRGSTRCTWHGIEARVLIPDLDQALVEAGKQERKRLSAAQLDRRLRAGRRK
jgi:hypothetical protein